MREIADFKTVIARSASAVIPSKKAHLTLKEIYYALSNEPEVIIVRCPQVQQKMAQKRKAAVSLALLSLLALFSPFS